MKKKIPSHTDCDNFLKLFLDKRFKPSYIECQVFLRDFISQED